MHVCDLCVFLYVCVHVCDLCVFFVGLCACL